MSLFVILAAGMAVIHLIAVWQKPRPAVIFSGLLWLAYAVYEHLIASGVLCDANCNIRVDLAFFLPLLGLASLFAYRSWRGLPGPTTLLVSVLGVLVILILGLLAEAYGYSDAAAIGAVLGLIAIGAYVVRARAKRT